MRTCVCVERVIVNGIHVIPQPQFKSVMLYQFLHLLLQVLIQQSHGLLQEEICCCMYNMAAVDFNLFHTRFMADFLQRCEGITADQRVEIAANYKPDEVRMLFHVSVYSNVLVGNFGMPEGFVTH